MKRAIFLALALISICVISQSQTNTGSEPAIYSSIDVDQSFEEDPDLEFLSDEGISISAPDESDTIVQYMIFIANSGQTRLKDVTAEIILPAGMKYHDGVLIDKNDAISLEDLDSFGWQTGDDNRKTVTFDIGVLETGSMYTVILIAKYRAEAVEISEYYGSEVRVCGIDPFGNLVCQTAEPPT